jgi:hypothetical protein
VHCRVKIGNDAETLKAQSLLDTGWKPMLLCIRLRR